MKGKKNKKEMRKPASDVGLSSSASSSSSCIIIYIIIHHHHHITILFFSFFFLFTSFFISDSFVHTGREREIIIQIRISYAQKTQRATGYVIGIYSSVWNARNPKREGVGWKALSRGIRLRSVARLFRFARIHIPDLCGGEKLGSSRKEGRTLARAVRTRYGPTGDGGGERQTDRDRERVPRIQFQSMVDAKCHQRLAWATLSFFPSLYTHHPLLFCRIRRALWMVWRRTESDCSGEDPGSGCIQWVQVRALPTSPFGPTGPAHRLSLPSSATSPFHVFVFPNKARSPTTRRARGAPYGTGANRIISTCDGHTFRSTPFFLVSVITYWNLRRGLGSFLYACVALDDCYGKTLSSPPLIQYGDKPTPQKERSLRVLYYLLSQFFYLTGGSDRLKSTGPARRYGPLGTV